MAIRITQDNIGSLTNKGIKADAERYVSIYNEFIADVAASGVEVSETDDIERRQELRNKLKKAGAEVRNDGKSVLLNAISPSCEDCRTGLGSATYIISLACNRDCYFCTNKNQFNYDERRKTVTDINGDYKRDVKRYKTMKSAGITGGEPLLFVKECCDFIKKSKKQNKALQTRIYTNGDLATTEVLAQLKTAGLDEIRFGIKPDDDGSVDQKILDTIAESVKYIPRVMVEMPIIPGTLEKMKELMLKLDAIGIYGVNILEFLYPWVHSQDYASKGYKVAKRPYGILFNYSYAGGLPIAGSEAECLELLLFLAEKKVKMGVHYCSLENKLTSQIYHHNFKVTLTGTEVFSQKDFFIKTLRGYGEDIEKIKTKLDEAGCSHYTYNTSGMFIEFSPEYLHLFKDEDMELAVCYLALDLDEEDRHVLRELQIDVLSTKGASADSL